MTWNNHHSTLRSQYSNRPQFRRNSRPGLFARNNHYRDFESLKWVKFLTVCGYVFFVSSPAAYLSYYYTCKWDPTYVNTILPDPQEDKPTTAVHLPYGFMTYSIQGFHRRHAVHLKTPTADQSHKEAGFMKHLCAECAYL
ncbi:Protein F32D8.15 [Aphelenchoides avenae]|nr:Protein F32D8.15 [Aphelenchus avenae]